MLDQDLSIDLVQNLGTLLVQVLSIDLVQGLSTVVA